MFGSLSDKLSRIAGKLGLQAKITEENIQDIVREIRMTLLEADVALPVVKELTSRIKEKAIGQVVTDRLSPGQTFVKILLEELVVILGKDVPEISFARQKPIVILLAGLQGVGKTTSAAKLGLWLRSKKQRAMLCSTDIYRPAAMEQLQQLCKSNNLDYFAATKSNKPVAMAQEAVEEARAAQMDVCIIDTAGRTSVDEEMMDEIAGIHKAITPVETLFVVDAMTGQDAANTARSFHERLDLTGVILSKADSDARGGSALSIATITGSPIRFMGVGEKATALEVFHPESMAKRILGMGDMLSVIEQVKSGADEQAMARLEKKTRSGKGFNLFDYRTQLQQMQKMGGVGSMLTKLPGLGGKVDSEAITQFAGRQARQHLALMDSMTMREKRFPDIINPSRKRRISAGAGIDPIELNRMLKQFRQMSKMMSKMRGKGGMKKMMAQLQAMGGGMPGRF